ncbi:secondary thiamine-phosphate synthase enzyme YjbQ [Pseudoalteromonas xiamenensis]|uniref:secondary thiamine-phosphate synthase enzyme YjbQ n=1 Tax=Pseudoalteromonas xiamenensis TaxID=882626 RepID=UPI0027E44447|nr:secondary thiamine-phosphate synthase enzyme YjbQ [Pseudoalteromonas xiamenensis]WMN58860.1 secondary thiamine-phosphate synthase enzyme YjbQ [Pseudoalteromonas xiamenensis]
MIWVRKSLSLKPRSRGFHLIDTEIVNAIPELSQCSIGLLHLFLQHTSASLTINENADPTVRMDLESHFNQFVPERQSYYRHDYEGDDDMPAHIKSSILGVSLTIPVEAGRLQMGTWQGVYLGEHRDNGGVRKLIVTLQGQ